MNYFQAKQNIEERVFVDLLSDSGFKAVYADPANKHLLINLLNNVLPDDVRVSDIVEYRDREQQTDTIFSKKTILDLVCRDSAGNIFGIEVQKKVDKDFAKRCVYYASGQYHSQLSSGGRYSELHPVYELAFLEEKYPHRDESEWDSEHIVSHYHLTEKRTGESLCSTIFIIFAELGRFTKSAEDCVTTRDKLFYWFKHAGDERESPLSIINVRQYSKAVHFFTGLDSACIFESNCAQRSAQRSRVASSIAPSISGFFL